jgi:hypothetical protein
VAGSNLLANGQQSNYKRHNTNVKRRQEYTEQKPTYK